MKVLKPTVGGHDGSSFRELLGMWGERGFCEVVPGDSTKSYSGLNESEYPEARPWVGYVGGILLYDNPITDKINPYLTWELALWANQVHKGPNCVPWTFWPKHPKVMEQVRNKGLLGWSERSINSIFIGSYTTNLRGTHDWGSVIQKYFMGPHSARILQHDSYLRALGNSKFGLCLPGVGPKCLRDIELIGMGTVPVFTPGVSTDYYSPLIEGVHYLYAETPEGVDKAIRGCSESKWKEMSEACRSWYEDNCSPHGSFKLTQRIIQENSGK